MKKFSYFILIFVLIRLIFLVVTVYFKTNTDYSALKNYKPNHGSLFDKKYHITNKEHKKSKNEQKSSRLKSKNFTHYIFNNYSLSIPNTMELREENSDLSHIIKVFSDEYYKVAKIKIKKSNFVFQPTGINDKKDITKWKKALSLYARILIYHKKNNTDGLFKWNDDLDISKEEYYELNTIFKNNLIKDLSLNKKILKNIDMIRINDIILDKNYNKFVYIEQDYERKGIKGNVIVKNYYIYNSDELVKLVISYRKSESNLWKKDFDKIINTFSFNHKKD